MNPVMLNEIVRDRVAENAVAQSLRQIRRRGVRGERNAAIERIIGDRIASDHFPVVRTRFVGNHKFPRRC